MFFFQIPWLPEALIRATKYRGIRDTFRNDPIRPGAFSEEDIESCIEAISRPGALTAGIRRVTSPQASIRKQVKYIGGICSFKTMRYV